LTRVFEPLFGLEESRSSTGDGTGLGLGIARNIARSRVGELTLENREKGWAERSTCIAPMIVRRNGLSMSQDLIPWEGVPNLVEI